MASDAMPHRSMAAAGSQIARTIRAKRRCPLKATQSWTQGGFSHEKLE